MIAVEALQEAESALAAVAAGKALESVGGAAADRLRPLLAFGPSAASAAAPASVDSMPVVETLSAPGRPLTVKVNDAASARTLVFKALPDGNLARLARAVLAQVRLARVEHEAIAKVRGLHAEAGRLFVVRDYVEGVPLHRIMEILKAEAVPPDAPTWRLAAGARGGGANVTGAKIVCRIGEHAASALAAAVAAGVVHGSLKEENLIVDPTVRPTVVDFGCGNPRVPFEAPEVLASSAPETARGEASDLYALGVVLYQCLTRKPVFEGDEAAVRQATAKTRPSRPSKHNFKTGKPMETITMALLEKEPGRRYPSAAALRDDLDRYHRNEPIERRSDSLLGRLFG
jgi:serine/threonine-protein kinase